jgi:hypothetical protein
MTKGKEIFFWSVQTISGAHPVSNSIGTEDFLHGVKMAKALKDPLVPRLRMQSPTTPPYTFMACQDTTLPFTYITGTSAA